ncbi:hypothetical protein [Corynebacterium sp. HMSC077G01]|uniref:hypothetical protein n=1 Tax=Corynebacterium sp. HMSC077G01 TaxID=1715193 RepID=UPI0008A0F943|nr:hypothetical protein [Corynebacterium sp. HMSC077G01]OFM13535.1 hypothetical protein HMPREF2714_07430 [Corynebacterium sp. HMSC077G01]
MQNHSNTNIEHNSDAHVTVESKRPRRRAAHLPQLETEEGLTTKCGHFIPRQHIAHVGNPANRPEYFECKACYAIDATEKELERDRNLFLLAAIHDLASKEL